MTPQIQAATKANVRALSRTLARAFYDDPVTVWLLPEEKGRAARLSLLFATLTRYHHLGAGGVEIACGDAGIGAAALWDPPGRWRETWLDELAMVPAMLRVFGFGSDRIGQLRETMRSVHPEEPHWYLAVIGSDPDVRGTGFGQALMSSRLDRVDREHCPAYLESSKAENIGYYERFGFEVTGEISLPDGPSLWPMWRKPR